MVLEQIYGVNTKDLIPISEGFHNTILSYQNLIFRLSSRNSRSLEEIESEVAYLQALGEKGVSVSLPIKSPKEKIIESTDQHYIVCFEKAKGNAVDVADREVWNKDLFFTWGRVSGRIHQVSKDIRINRPTWSPDNPDILNLLPKIKSKIIANRYEQLLKLLGDFEMNSNLFGLIHNDFHQGNFFVNKGEITIFDFDDSAYHWFAYDLAVSFYHAYWQASSFTPENTEFPFVFWKYFLKGYMQEHLISKELIQQIPIFLKIREIFLYTLFMEKWDTKNLEDWQEYTLTNLKNKIETGEPFSEVNFTEMIDNLVKDGISLSFFKS
ncbi:phosphotransferase enzyme family protein [Bacillus sp. OK048]|uniref:phosphotransferase enzyme family protein n=1 Tax=Bacillus sp. OK048 TaxID=1882761 RepID=UPI0008876C0E|nr:phosphotransferase [Bacillus sp. OK048]SDN29399.1 Ser/Thr protein kinase RdoA involved in Cpx stress response, MazF antagonist [Bacillus sp. OK048]